MPSLDSLTRLALALVAASALLVACGDDSSDDAADGDGTYQYFCARQIGCPADGEETEAQCLAIWESVMSNCPTEGQALLDCAKAQPDESLVCNARGQTDIPESACVSEREAALACAS